MIIKVTPKRISNLERKRVERTNLKTLNLKRSKATIIITRITTIKTITIKEMENKRTVPKRIKITTTLLPEKSTMTLKKPKRILKLTLSLLMLVTSHLFLALKLLKNNPRLCYNISNLRVMKRRKQRVRLKLIAKYLL